MCTTVCTVAAIRVPDRSGLLADTDELRPDDHWSLENVEPSSATRPPRWAVRSIWLADHENPALHAAQTPTYRRPNAPALFAKPSGAADVIGRPGLGQCPPPCTRIKTVATQICSSPQNKSRNGLNLQRRKARAHAVLIGSGRVGLTRAPVATSGSVAPNRPGSTRAPPATIPDRRERSAGDRSRYGRQ